MTTPATSPTKRKVPCSDGFDRPRHLTTYRAGDRVVLLAPPAEAALLTPAGARELANYLAEHAEVVETTRRTSDRSSIGFPQL